MYKTQDMYLAAYLAAKGCRWLSRERDGRQVIFCFEASQALKDAVYDWEFNDAPVSAKRYRDRLKEVKGQIYVVLDNP
jgi:hypothetical protein